MRQRRSVELRKRFNAKAFLAVGYVLVAVIYIVIGLQPARAIQYDTYTQIIIPEIELVSDVTKLTLDNNALNTPDAIVGSYSRNQNKTLLIGHSTSVFQNLKEVKMYSEILYNGNRYVVTEIKTMGKSEINMNQILKSEDRETLIIMTCAGELLENGDATYRLLVTAVLDE